MYTQCPECGVAFRVTAEVLKQAAGKVRCGGCGVAFNALAHLSEQKKPATPVQPESTPESHVPELKPEAPNELEADTPPESISAEQSAALLKTLDQLAGSDIRIEDTGIEWRVLDSDEDDEDDGLELESDQGIDTGSMRFVIEGEVDEAPAEDALESSNDEPYRVIDEMRFDDNTPLPDDFDIASEAAPSPKPVVEPVVPAPEPEHAQVDLALGDPDEWEDLLGDIGESSAAEEPHDDPVMQADAQTEDTPDVPPDMDTQFAIQAEAMGIDLTGIHESGDEEEIAEEPTAEDEADPDIKIDDEEVEVDVDVEDEPPTSIEDDLIAAAFEAEAAVQALEATASEEAPDLDEEGDDEDEVEEEQEEEEIELEIDIDIEPQDEPEIEDDVEDIAQGFDDKVEEVIETIAASFDDMDDPAEASDEHVIPEMTEEEKTINMMIDQELFNIAVEDEEGFASTIVQLQPDKKVEDELGGSKKKDKKGKEKVKEDSTPVVETIIMEGEFVRSQLDKERLAADKEVKSRRFDDPGISIPRGRDDYQRRSESSPAGAGTIISVVALALLLILQVLHQSREALATVPAFNSAVGPIYRMLGQPLTPTWNISGWRIEATKGSTDELDQLLTIYSRLGNKSEQALPYPLVHLSLTDRFEEIIGSTVLEPGEYLAENADPRKLVPPGNTFNAVITIESPTEDATGFKLDVCYRLASGQLRCAIEDFK